MYRYGDGTPFPLDENFIETLTSAVEACTEGFAALVELDERRVLAEEGRHAAQTELSRLTELDRAVSALLAPYLGNEKRPSPAEQVAQKLAGLHKQLVAAGRTQVEQRVQQLDQHASPGTVADNVTAALRPFFNSHQLPQAQWITSWDVRGTEAHAHAVATAGAIGAAFSLSPDPWRAPIRVDQLADGVVVHMMKKGVFGKARAAPVELAKYVVVAFDRATNEQVITLRESAARTAPGLRFAVGPEGATWVTISPSGDADGEPSPLDFEDIDGVRRLADSAHKMLDGLTKTRTLLELSLHGTSLQDLEDPHGVIFELLAQLAPYARSIRDKSRAQGELVLKLDIGDGRREELFVPRATLAQQFARLPDEYRKPFEDMGIAAEDTRPAIQVARQPARARIESSDLPTIVLESDD